MHQKIKLVMTIVLLWGAFALAREVAVYVTNSGSPYCIVIDAGHGGMDPGKIAVTGVLEKDINLNIALQLKERLEEANIPVLLTRSEDVDLADPSSENKKVSDMHNRCHFITEAMPLFTVSIHQNSYPKPDISGAQVFYYTHSAEGKKLAEIMQKNLIALVDPKNKRSAKENDSYYLLKKTPTPTVIVECGFLSNPTEAELLTLASYQEKLVHAIFSGILEYLTELGY